MNTVALDQADSFIQVLPDLVINQIAAGEVVERPSSVVRELVDNAIDAGATVVRVSLEDGGIAKIAVTDDGCGMSFHDLKIAFQRHATSKIRSAEDLNMISTLGFRGEALPSIASIAKVRVMSRRRKDEIGTLLEVHGGEVICHELTPRAPGTTIEVAHLFFNTPARKKFLKTARTEEARVKGWLRSAAIAHAQVQFRFEVGNREVFNLAPRESSIERAREIFSGADIRIQERIEHLEIQGLLSHPSSASHENSQFVLLVNGRVVSDRMILRAVRDGFDSTLKSHEFPSGFLSLTVAPQLVDVNVHPQKSEVRFISSQSIYSLVRSVVRRGLLNFTGVHRISDPEDVTENQEMQRQPFAASSQIFSSAAQAPAPLKRVWSVPPTNNQTLQEHAFYQVPQDAPPQVGEGASRSVRAQDMRVLGIVLQCYIVAEYLDTVYLIDMHAAHERIMFNTIRAQRFSKEPVRQQLLIPLEIQLSEQGVARIEEARAYLESVAFKIVCEHETVTLHALPSCLSESSARRIITEIAVLDESALPDGVVAERFDALAARAACHASVRSGDSLTREEIYALLKDMDAAELGSACPHGRPVITQLPRAQIERWFGRDD
jgi:DNA mismatch repair protein MutL